ncbi:ureidoglycolate lyase [Cupriavidus gilardii]|uniref:ureidoglycolate lyase n=1 Tax=Cupriavidus gilardii TaxID=82541 RepID=UPI001EE5BAFA|nr:ureidoglycolate lyase [Cupriavidus gilardii]MCG5262364.1 ureidoglycolate lyase [Cupriavidus gilardii]MDF9431168.1 ureidoglycolate lyase [Cupriavidus gilardii]
MPLPTESLPLIAQPLTADAFAPFGQVIESDGHAPIAINRGMCHRFHDLAEVDVSSNEGRPLINLFQSQPYALPLALTSFERHPLGSQAFIPLGEAPFLVVVAPPGDTIEPQAVRAFVTNGRQGVNYRKGVWHHSLIVTESVARFVVVDRGGPGNNCDELELAGGTTLWLTMPETGREGASEVEATLF